MIYLGNIILPKFIGVIWYYPFKKYVNKIILLKKYEKFSWWTDVCV